MSANFFLTFGKTGIIMSCRQGKQIPFRIEKEMYFIMANKRGTLSINSDNIFPIIKKWLYSDHDIFFREMISNGCDAIKKLESLRGIGQKDTRIRSKSS